MGVPIAGRLRPEWELMIGFFVNTLVMRGDMSGEPTFRELLARVRRVVAGGVRSPGAAVREAGGGAEPSAEPWPASALPGDVPTGRVRGGRATLPGLDVAPLAGAGQRVRFDLEMHLRMQPAGSLRGTIIYSTDLFDAATIGRLAGHFRTLLDGIVADPDTTIDRLPLLTQDERRQLLVGWNDTARDYPREKCVHELFEDQAARTPDAVAVVCGDRRLTYRELDDRADRLAHHLAALGVGPGALVGVLLERSPDLIVALVGILKAGGAYLPLDPEAPPQRLAFLLGDGGARLVLSQASLRDRLAATGVQSLCIDEVADLGNGGSPAIRRPSPGAEGLAYVMYTSGSTGVPKGVEVPHRAISRLLFGVDYARFDASMRMAQLAPISFDASTLEIWGPLLHGGCCVQFPDGVPDFADLERGLTRHRVQTLWLTASLFNTVIDERPNALRGIEQLLIGGEALFRAPCPPGAEPAGAGDPADQRIRPDGMHDVRLLLSDPGRPARGRGLRPDRPANRQHASLRPGPAGGAGADRGAGRVAHRRRRSGPWVSQSARADLGHVRLPSLQRGPGFAAVQDGGQGPLVTRWKPGIPGTTGPAGKDPRLPHRTRGDRSRAGGPSGREPMRGRCA